MGDEEKNSAYGRDDSPCPAQGTIEKASVEPPIPLTAPDGRVFAYACPRCLHVNSSLSGGDLQKRIEWSWKGADRCCRCRDCGVVVDSQWKIRCAACEVKERARWDAYVEKTQPEWDAQAERREIALALAKDTNAAVLLRTLMSDISEEYWCAGWLSGLEFTLWQLLNGGQREIGMFGRDVSEDQVADLKRLSEQAGGWWYYNDKDGETFIPIKDWLPRAEGAGASSGE
jgi:hypothetical protein